MKPRRILVAFGQGKQCGLVVEPPDKTDTHGAPLVIEAIWYNNTRVAGLYQSLHPAVLRAIKQVVEDAHVLGKPVSVCGEMAGDPAAVLALLGLGVDSLSMSAGSLPRVKWVIRSFSTEEARDLLSRVWELEDPRAIRALYNSVLEQGGLGGLVRAGN